MAVAKHMAGHGDVRRYPRKWQYNFGDSGNELWFNDILHTIIFFFGFEVAGFYNRDKLERRGLQYVSSTEGPMGGRPKRRSPSTIILHLFLPSLLSSLLRSTDFQPSKLSESETSGYLAAGTIDTTAPRCHHTCGIGPVFSRISTMMRMEKQMPIDRAFIAESWDIIAGSYFNWCVWHVGSWESFAFPALLVPASCSKGGLRCSKETFHVGWIQSSFGWPAAVVCRRFIKFGQIFIFVPINAL
jgi:hypothetical protein